MYPATSTTAYVQSPPITQTPESRVLAKEVHSEKLTGQKREHAEDVHDKWESSKKKARHEEELANEQSVDKSQEKSDEEVVVVWPEDAKIVKESNEKVVAEAEQGAVIEKTKTDGEEKEKTETEGGEKEKTETENEKSPKAMQESEEEEEDDGKFVRYNRVVVNGATYELGDTVALWPPSRRKGAPMGTIKCLLTDGENNNMEIEWFYRPEETILKGKGKIKVPEREVFLSSHADLNPIESIAKKVKVKWDREVADLEEYVKEPDCYYYTKKYNFQGKCFEDL